MQSNCFFRDMEKNEGENIFQVDSLYKCIQLNWNENESLCVSALSLVPVCENAMSRHHHHYLHAQGSSSQTLNHFSQLESI